MSDLTMSELMNSPLYLSIQRLPSTIDRIKVAQAFADTLPLEARSYGHMAEIAVRLILDNVGYVGGALQESAMESIAALGVSLPKNRFHQEWLDAMNELDLDIGPRLKATTSKIPPTVREERDYWCITTRENLGEPPVLAAAGVATLKFNHDNDVTAVSYRAYDKISQSFSDASIEIINPRVSTARIMCEIAEFGPYRDLVLGTAYRQNGKPVYRADIDVVVRHALVPLIEGHQHAFEMQGQQLNMDSLIVECTAWDSPRNYIALVNVRDKAMLRL
jgi:hypothetical protein